MHTFRQKIIFAFAAFSLLLNSFIPLISVNSVYAQEATDSAQLTAQEEVVPPPFPTPEPSPTPPVPSEAPLASRSEPEAGDLEESASPEVSPSPSAESSSEPSPSPGPAPTPPLWTEESGTYTTQTLELGVTYRFPPNEKVSLTFNKLPEVSGTVTVREHEAFHFEITSTMINGTFEFDLTLPTNDPAKKVLTSDDGQNYDVVSNETVASSDVVTIKDITHLTHFIVADETANFNHVVINEFLADGSDEWVEMYNPTNQEQNITGWSIEDNDPDLGSPFTFPEGSAIPAKGFLAVDITVTLNDGGDTVNFISGDGTLLDSHTYSSDPGSSSIGRSIDGGSTFTTFATPTRGVSNGTTLNTLYVDNTWASPSNDGDHTWGFDAFNTIQEAINFAPAGATVNVAVGTYNESLTINKPLTLSGPGTSLATINGCDSTLNITANSVSISGFFVTNDCGDDATIFVSSNLQNVTISGNIIRDGYYGIYTNSPVTIQGNEIMTNIYGIYLTGSVDGSQITSNNIHDNGEGISASSASFNQLTISGNQITNSNDGYGIYFNGISGSAENISALTISNNQIIGGSNYGIYLSGGGGQITYGAITISGNTVASSSYGGGIYADVIINSTFTISNNTVGANSDPDDSISGNSGNGIYICAEGYCNNSTLNIKGNTISGNSSNGLYLYQIFSSTVSIGGVAQADKNTITNNGSTGIYIQYIGTPQNPSNVTILNNTISSNSNYGLYLDDTDEVSQVTIGSSNTISQNSSAGIYLNSGVTGVSITGNTITGNGIGEGSPSTGIVVQSASGNEAHENIISGNGDIEVQNDDFNGVAFDATLNWWGTAIASEILSKLSGLVSFSPWYTSAQMQETNVIRTGKSIISFNIDSPSVDGVISGNTVNLYVPNGTDVTALTPLIEVSDGASVYPNSGETQDFTNAITYGVVAEDNSQQEYVVTVNVVEEDQTVPDGEGNVTVTNTNPQAVITSSTQAVNLTISSGTTSPKIDYSSLITGGTGTIPQTTIDSEKADIAIPASTTVTSADPTWNGVIAAPTVTTVTLPQTSGETKTLSTAIEIGFSGAKLSFDKAVKLVLTGQAGKRAGYVRTGITFTEITSICAANNQATGDALVADGDCKIDQGSDLVIWTKHFTQFATYTQTSTPPSASSSQALSSAGGGGSAPSCSDQKPGSAPTLLNAIPGVNSVTLNWKKAANPVSYYLVNYSTIPGKFQFGNPNVGGADTTSYQVSGLSGGTTYYFKVRAGNGCAPGDYSNELAQAPTGGFVSGPAAGFAAGVLGAKTKTGEQVIPSPQPVPQPQTIDIQFEQPQVSGDNLFSRILGFISNFFKGLFGR